MQKSMSLSCRSRAGKFPRKGQMENLGRGFVDLTVSVLTTSFCTIAWKKPQTTRKQINMASSQWHLIGNGPDLTCGLVCQLRLQHNNKNQRLLTTNHRSGPALHVRSILAHLKLILWIRNIMMSTLQARGGCVAWDAEMTCSRSRGSKWQGGVWSVQLPGFPVLITLPRSVLVP